MHMYMWVFHINTTFLGENCSFPEPSESEKPSTTSLLMNVSYNDDLKSIIYICIFVAPDPMLSSHMPISSNPPTTEKSQGDHTISKNIYCPLYTITIIIQ